VGGKFRPVSTNGGSSEEESLERGRVNDRFEEKFSHDQKEGENEDSPL
jgi:hypothetical protein